MVSAASMTPTASPRIDNSPHTGARLVSTDGLALPLQAAELEVDAKGGLARTVLTQTFVNPGSSPLHVQYLLPLPADGAVSGFSFKIADELVAGEVQTKQVAQERYTQALIEGRTAALVQQSRTSLFRQSVGNIPPHETVVAKIVVDQPLRWLEEAGAWQWRFPTVVAPRYQGAAGRVKDAAELAVDVSAEPLTVRMGLQLKIRDSISEGARPSSSSHSLHVKAEGATLVRLADEGGARLDRDVVVHWPVAAPQPGASLDVVRPAAAAHGGDAFGLLTLVPPALSAGWGAVARDLVVLIDTSGSMGGEPLNQAKRVISALIDTLGEQDRLELISFDYSPTRFRKAPISASPKAKREAQDWLQALSAGGGTEMHAAVQEALRPLRQGAQRQVVLVTDGYIGFEREIVHKVRTALPASCRLHTVGVGSSVNRSLTQAAARAGAGVEIIIAPTEDPERAAQRLVARTDRPVVTELVIEGQGLQGHAPVHLPDLFAGTPAQVSLRLSGAGGQVRLRGRTPDGELVQSIAYPGMALGQGAGQIAVRYARERVFDLEAHKVGGGDAQEIDAQIEQLGLDFQIATDLTSWVAVSEKVRVDPAETAQTVNQPHEAPQHVSLAGVGLRPPALSLASSSGGAPAMERAVASGFGGVARSRKAKKGRGMAPPPPAPRPASISEFVDEEDFDDDLSLADEVEDGFSAEGAWQEVSADKAEVDREEMAKELVADPLPLKRAAAAKPSPSAAPAQPSAAMPPPADGSPSAKPPMSQAAPQEPEPEPEALSAQIEPAAPVRRSPRRGRLWALLVVLAAILGALWWFLRPQPVAQDSSSKTPASSAPRSGPAEPKGR